MIVLHSDSVALPVALDENKKKIKCDLFLDNLRYDIPTFGPLEVT